MATTNEILKAYEKFGDTAVVANLFKIEDWEVLEALAKAPPGFLFGMAIARTLDALIEGLRHLRRRLKTKKAESTAGVCRDLGRLLVEFQSKRKAVGADVGADLDISAEEEKRLRETINALGDHDDSNDRS